MMLANSRRSRQCSESHCESVLSCLVLRGACQEDIYCGKGVHTVDILDVHLFSVRAVREKRDFAFHFHPINHEQPPALSSNYSFVFNF